MPSVQEMIHIIIKNGIKEAAIPCNAIIAELYCEQLPASTSTFSEIINYLQDYTKRQFKAKDSGLKMPTQSSFNNCNGRWSEYVYAVSAWNELASMNADKNADTVYVYTKLPNNNSTDNEWISLLNNENYLGLQHFSRDNTDFAVHNAGHTAFLLCSSNPDAVILKFNKSTYSQLHLPLDPCTQLQNLSSSTMQGLDNIYASLRGKATPHNNLACFLSIKNSIRPDRRYQFIHEGNNIKAILLYLVSLRIDSRLTREIVQKRYYAVSLSRISSPDSRVMETAMTACLMDLTSEPIWSVDKLYQCIQLGDVGAQIREMLA